MGVRSLPERWTVLCAFERSPWHADATRGQRWRQPASCGELRRHEYQREVAVDTQRTAIAQRVWEIRVDSVLKFDRAVNRESNDDSGEEAPR